MNKTHSVVAKALACIAVFLSLSCTNPLSAGRDAAAAVATSEKGVLTVTIGDPGAGRAKTIVPAASDLPAIATYELTLTCTGQTTKSATFTTLTGSINYLVPGTWTVAVVGKTAGGITVASGSKDVAVTASASAEVTVNLAYITASATDLGSMSLTLTFPKTVGIDSVVASIDGAAVAPALEIMDNGDTDNKIVCAATGITVPSPLVRIYLKKSGLVLLTWVERVWIYKNITTTNSSALAASSFNAAPPTPTSLGAALQADNSIILNWPNVGTAETYAVERSEDAGNTYTEVNAAILGGTTSYIDGLTAPIKTYLYRILAKNTFGQSGYTATGSSTATAAPVSMLAIPGVIAPVRGAIPVTAVTTTDQYTGTITWSGAPVTFAGAVVYTATIALTAKAGFTMTGVAADSLTVAGAMATNTANAGTVAAAFPATAPAIIDIAALLGVTPPVLGAAPASTITPTAQYTGSVSWTPTAGSFGAATVYTAHVVLAAKAGWTLNAVTADFFTVAGSSSSTNPADSGAVTAAFPATAAANILAAGVTGFVAPVTGVTNQLVGSLTRGAVSYSVTSLTWSPTTTPYTQGTAYTATVVLSSAAGYKFPSAGIAQPTATAGGGTVSAGTTTGGDVSGNALSFTVAFPATISDAAVVAAAKAALAIGYGSGDSAASVTQNLSLPASGSGGSTVTWGETSDTGGNLAIAGGTGTITRPAYTLGNGSATLRATITKGAASDTKDFTLTILAHAGTVADPYEICTLAQLVTMRDNINGAVAGANALAYKLMADIDIGSFNTGIGWVPIGNLAVKFTGDFHGNGKTISNLYINEAAADYKGLFGYFGGTAVGLSKIHDLTLTSVNVTGNMRTAGLAGVADSYFGYITNCSVTSGTVSGAVYAVGGLVGYNSTNTVTNCSAAVAVTLRSGNSAGGLVGSNFYHGYIYGSHATGTVQGTSANQLGGLVGSNSNYGPLTTCFATGSVTGFYAVGGLVGVLEGKSTAAGLTDCYATGAVSATYTTSGRAGGLVGYAYGSGIEVVLANCYATGAVTAGTNNGGLVGYVMSGTTTATRSFYDTNTTGMTAANEAHGTATTTANMKVQATFAGWNYSTIWNIGAGVNNGYPYLR